ncbi:MAG: hypothetical protein ABEJ36_04095 [Candidatus Nanosalina sp.]
MSVSPDDLDDIDGYFDRLPFDPRDTDYRQDIQALYGNVSDDVIGVMEQLVEQREDATESAIESMFRETYNQGIIDGTLAGAEEAGDEVDNHFPNGFYGEGGFMSPVFNFGEMEEVPSGGFMSPTYNFGSRGFSGNGVDIPESWDGYDWPDGWGRIDEPQSTPEEVYTGFQGYEASGAGRKGSTLIYNPQFVSDGRVTSGMGFPDEDDDQWESPDMPWGNRAS